MLLTRISVSTNVLFDSTIHGDYELTLSSRLAVGGIHGTSDNSGTG